MEENKVETEATESPVNAEAGAAESSEKVAEESVEELRAKLEEESSARKKAEDLANNQKIRAEKAEKRAKDAPTVTETKSDLTPRDAIALFNAKVTEEEDINEVVEYAKFRKVPVSEALKSSTVKTILAEKAEHRKVAEATNVSTSRRSSAEVSDEAVLNKARSGNLPESESEIERLLKAKTTTARKK